MLDLLRERPGMHIAALGTHFAMSDVAVLKHVRVLERAGLVLSRREGRIRQLYFNVMPIQAIYERWTDEYGAFWAGQVAAIKSRVEGRAQQRGARRA
jgi:DNA-binding transcriptional ArsR family regulator